MGQLLAKFFPYAVFLYFLARSFKEPVYLLGIPFLIFLRYCIFFQEVKIFRVPNSLNANVLFIIWLIIIWIVFSCRPLFQSGFKRIKLNTKKGLNWMDFIIAVLILLSLVDLFSVMKEYYINSEGVFTEFIELVSLFLGYFIVKNLVSYIPPDKLKKVLYSIVVVNSIAGIFYFIHQGLHITLYDSENYSKELLNGEVITRNMFVMPVLVFFSIAYLVTYLNERPIVNMIMLFINFMSLFFTYFRSFIVIGFMVVLLYYIFTAYKKKTYFAILKYIFIIGVGGLIFVFVVAKVTPGGAKYFLNRVDELRKNPKDDQDNHLIYRFNRTGDIFQRMDPAKRFAGLGPVSETQIKWIEDVDDVTSDLVWTAVVFRWGYLGFALFILLYLIAIKKSFRLFMDNEGAVSHLGMLIFLVIISQILEGFITWTFMSPDRFAMGLWYLGFLSALSGFKDEKTLNDENEYFT